MPLTDPTDTLAYHQSRALTTSRCMSDIMVATVIGRVKNYIDAHANPNASPESEALRFYTMNHGMALIATTRHRYEPLPPDERKFVEQYYARMSASAARAFVYLLLICTREARHNKSLSTSIPQMAKLFGSDIAHFHKSGNGESGIHNALLVTPPNGTIGNYVKSLAWAFYNSSWSGGFGGEAWGQVTDCLVRFVTGEFTAEMMLDTIWTLAHNNGPIFNKGHCYSNYSQNLYRILDIQRSGQMPEAVLHDQHINHFVDPELLTCAKWIKAKYPDKIGDYVDWYLVEALGAVHQYPKEKNKQKAKHGLHPKFEQLEKLAEEKKLADMKKKAAQKSKEEAETFWIMPKVKLKKFERNAA